MAIKLLSLGILVLGLFFVFLGGLNILSITGNVVITQSGEVDVQSLYALPSIQAGTKYDVSIHDSECPKCFKRIAKVEQRNIFGIWEERIDPDPLYDRPMLMLGLSSETITAADGEIYLRIYHPYRAQPVPQSRLDDGTPTVYKITFELSKNEHFEKDVIQKEVSAYLIPEEIEEQPSSSGSGSNHVILPDEVVEEVIVVNETVNETVDELVNATQDSALDTVEETVEDETLEQGGSSGASADEETLGRDGVIKSTVDLEDVSYSADADYVASNSGFMQRLSSNTLTDKEQSFFWWVLIVLGVCCIGFFVFKKTFQK